MPGKSAGAVFLPRYPDMIPQIFPQGIVFRSTVEKAVDRRTRQGFCLCVFFGEREFSRRRGGTAKGSMTISGFPFSLGAEPV